MHVYSWGGCAFLRRSVHPRDVPAGQRRLRLLWSPAAFRAGMAHGAGSGAAQPSRCAAASRDMLSIVGGLQRGTAVLLSLFATRVCHRGHGQTETSPVEPMHAARTRSPSNGTITLYYHSIPSLCTVTAYYHTVLSLETINIYYHSVLSFCTVVPYCRTVLSFFIVNIPARSIVTAGQRCQSSNLPPVHSGN